MGPGLTQSQVGAAPGLQPCVAYSALCACVSTHCATPKGQPRLSHAPAPPPPPPPPRPPQLQELYRQDLLFRIHALRRRFPEYVTPGMASGWATDVAAGRSMSATVLRDFQLRDPAVRRELERQGARGSGGARFGGGSGGGGGGGGRSAGGGGGSW